MHKIIYFSPGNLKKILGFTSHFFFTLFKLICLFVCFVALRPKSTAMVMAGQSVHLTTLFPDLLEQAVNQYFVHILSLVTDNNPS